ncbi:hypothetical protein AMECASPLE_039685 [Ameca splendens]|uniref:Uncharacterized protein n=1 Tax=Ameca splendens TaxID=208324 RepID=A0ABV0XXU3_9TELE
MFRKSKRKKGEKDKLKDNLLFYCSGSVDATKPKTGLGCIDVTTRLILHDFPPALTLGLFGTTCYVLMKPGISKWPSKCFLALYLIPCPGPTASKVCHPVMVRRRKPYRLNYVMKI